jgi:hypothetical protein
MWMHTMSLVIVTLSLFVVTLSLSKGAHHNARPTRASKHNRFGLDPLRSKCPRITRLRKRNAHHLSS